MADSDALHITRTKASSAVGIQKTLEKRRRSLFSSISAHLSKFLFHGAGSLTSGAGAYTLKQERLEAP
jgi:hypothetical protein